MSKPAILLYDPIGSPWVGKLKQTCAVQGLPLRVLESADLGRTLAALAMGAAQAADPAPAPNLPEPMLILCGLTGAQLDRTLAAFRRVGVPRAVLKAVLTPHNAGWTPPALYQELCKERLAMAGDGPRPEHFS